MRFAFSLPLLSLSALLASTAAAQTVPCSPSWQPTFGQAPGAVLALVGHDDGSGPALYAGYYATPSGYLGRWNGTAWSWLGSFTPGSAWWDGFGWHYSTWVGSLAEFDAGSGAELYAAGNFHLLAGTTSAGFIAEWNGVQWSDLQGGMSGGYPQYYGGWGGVYYETQVNALTVFDDGTGRALYVGGDFTHAGTVATNFVARWNGSAWSALGIGLNGPVFSLTEYDDGSGPALYVGGAFTGAGGVSTHGIARWNGGSWSALGSAAGGLSGGWVECLAAFDDGSGPALFAGGWFGVAGGQAAYHVAKWNGSSWSVIGTWNAWNDEIDMLNTLDDGTGPALYAGGHFTPAGGGAPMCLMRWNGSAWSALGNGVSGSVEATTVSDIGSGPALYAGGSFLCLESGDFCLARWAPPSGCLAICEPGSGGVSACPCSNPPGGPGRGCDNSAATGGAALGASGIAGLAQDTLVFRTSGETASALSIVLQADALDASGSVFGQGVRCVSGTLIRLYVKTAHSGSISAPRASDASVSARSAQLGDTIAPGSQRHYGVYYRDPQVLGGCPATSTFDITQQLSVLWQP